MGTCGVRGCHSPLLPPVWLCSMRRQAQPRPGGGVGRVRLACGAGPRPGPRGPFRLLGTGSSGLSRPFGVRLSLHPCPRHLPGKLAVRPVLVGAVPFTLSHTSFVGLQADGWTDRCAQRDGFRQHARGVCRWTPATLHSAPSDLPWLGTRSGHCWVFRRAPSAQDLPWSPGHLHAAREGCLGWVGCGRCWPACAGPPRGLRALSRPLTCAAAPACRPSPPLSKAFLPRAPAAARTPLPAPASGPCGEDAASAPPPLGPAVAAVTRQVPRDHVPDNPWRRLLAPRPRPRLAALSPRLPPAP